MTALVLATRNRHKQQEFERLLEPLGIRVEVLPDGVQLPPEDGDTFAANALSKARAAALALQGPALGDDSGIEASALGGRPGIRSARYAGPDATDEQNLAKLLAETPAGSPLRYVCALAYVDLARGVERVFAGTCTGVLADRTGGSRGFGYDPAFLPDADLRGGRTMAELSDVEKDAISHRGVAARAFAEWLTGGGAPDPVASPAR